MNLTFIVSNTIILPGNVLPSMTVFGIFPPNLLFLVVKILVLSFCYRRLLAATRAGSSRNWQCPNYHIRWLQEVCYRPCYIFQPAYWYQDGCIYWRSKADKKSVRWTGWLTKSPCLFQHLLLVWVSISQMSGMSYTSEYQTAWNHGCKRLEEAVEMETTVLVCFHICHCYVSIVPTHK